MIQTVIGMFDNDIDAQNAVQKLCNKGFSKEHIEVTSSGLGDNESVAGANDEEGGITGFFKNLFSNREDSDKYVRVAKYSESIVSVQVYTTAEAESAAEILDACGAVNVDERAASLHYSPSGETGAVSDESTEKLSRSALATGFDKKEVEWPGKTTKISIMA